MGIHRVGHGWRQPPGPPKPHLSPGQPTDFSPATTAALSALIASKADDQTFAVAFEQPTLARFTGYASWRYTSAQQPNPEYGFSPTLALLLAPVSAASARLYSWSLIYRGQRQGGSLCADQAQDSIARGLCCQQALQWMNALDLQYGTSATPNPRPDVAGLALDPEGRIIGKLLGNVGPKVTTDE